MPAGVLPRWHAIRSSLTCTGFFMAFTVKKKNLFHHKWSVMSINKIQMAAKVVTCGKSRLSITGISVLVQQIRREFFFFFFALCSFVAGTNVLNVTNDRSTIWVNQFYSCNNTWDEFNKNQWFCSHKLVRSRCLLANYVFLFWFMFLFV